MQGLNCIFLLDKNPPSKIVLLKRAFWKEFAPNFYTGIGGKMEEGESIEEGAYRELNEETGIKDVKIKEFARVILDKDGFNPVILYYFWGILTKEKLPDCSEGDLEWVEVKKLLRTKIIPTTLEMFKEWDKRAFNLETKFSVYLKSIGLGEGKVSLVEKLKVLDSLDS